MIGMHVLKLFEDGTFAECIKKPDNTYEIVKVLRKINMKSQQKNEKTGKNKDKKKADNVFCVIKKINDSSLPVSMLRTCPFLPINKISKTSVVYQNFIKNKNVLNRKTDYGIIETRNRILTQRHKAIFDIIMSFHSLSENNDKKTCDHNQNGRFAITFTIYAIAKKLGLQWGKTTRESVVNALKEITDTGIIIRSKDDHKGVSFHIIETITWNESGVCRIILSNEYVNYFYTNLAVNYDKRLDEILMIKGKGSALIHSIVDFFITHKIGESDNKIMRIGFMKLMSIIGYPTDSERMQRSALSYISSYKNDLKRFSITYIRENRTFEYRGTDDIKFIR